MILWKGPEPISLSLFSEYSSVTFRAMRQIASSPATQTNLQPSSHIALILPGWKEWDSGINFPWREFIKGVLIAKIT